jgi:hypothetical protein
VGLIKHLLSDNLAGGAGSVSKSLTIQAGGGVMGSPDQVFLNTRDGLLSASKYFFFFLKTIIFLSKRQTPPSHLKIFLKK